MLTGEGAWGGPAQTGSPISDLIKDHLDGVLCSSDCGIERTILQNDGVKLMDRWGRTDKVMTEEKMSRTFSSHTLNVKATYSYGLHLKCSTDLLHT